MKERGARYSVRSEILTYVGTGHSTTAPVNVKSLYSFFVEIPKQGGEIKAVKVEPASGSYSSHVATSLVGTSALDGINAMDWSGTNDHFLYHIFGFWILC
jgi:hypothetical protein